MQVHHLDKSMWMRTGKTTHLDTSMYARRITINYLGNSMYKQYNTYYITRHIYVVPQSYKTDTQVHLCTKTYVESATQNS